MGLHYLGKGKNEEESNLVNVVKRGEEFVKKVNYKGTDLGRIVTPELTVQWRNFFRKVF